jgi:hypothetical protein
MRPWFWGTLVSPVMVRLWCVIIVAKLAIILSIARSILLSNHVVDLMVSNNVVTLVDNVVVSIMHVVVRKNRLLGM